MFRALLVAALLGVSTSPLDAREPQRTEKAAPRAPRDLRSDIERISREIYRPAPPVRAPKKR
jgi:hypothetical protein